MSENVYMKIYTSSITTTTQKREVGRVLFCFVCVFWGVGVGLDFVGILGRIYIYFKCQHARELISARTTQQQRP